MLYAILYPEYPLTEIRNIDMKFSGKNWMVVEDSSSPDGSLQGFDIVDRDTNDIILGTEGLYSNQEEEAILMAASPKLYEALKQAREAMQKANADVSFIDDALALVDDKKALEFPE